MPKQRKQIRQGVFEAAIKHQHFPADFLPSHPLVVVRLNAEVTLEQLNHWQIGRRFAMRNGVGFQDEAASFVR